MATNVEELPADADAPGRDRTVSFGARLGLGDGELDALVLGLRDSTRDELGRTLEQIRRAPAHLRPTLAIAIPLVLARDGLAPAEIGRVLAGLRAVIERFPAQAWPASGGR